jgi:hypothetical protein
MGAANTRAFGLPGVRQLAMGYGTPEPIGYGTGVTARTGGMRQLKPVELPTGLEIVRFGQKRLDEPRMSADSMGVYHRRGTNLSHRGLIGTALEGSWWLEAGQFANVRAYADAQRIAVSAAISALCVIPPEWSDLDVMVTARLMAPLLAYRGRPNPVNMRGVHVPVVRDLNGGEVMQLYIPGLGSGDVVRQALMYDAPIFLHPDAVRR